MTTDHYFERGARATGAAQVLEVLDRRPDDRLDGRPSGGNDEESGDEKCG